jgi:hypothetical protein
MTRSKQPSRWMVAGKPLFGFWFPFFGFRDEIPPAEATIVLGLRGQHPALVAEWLGRGTRIFFGRAKKASRK